MRLVVAILIFVVFTSNASQAQLPLEKKGILLEKERSFGLKLNTSGLGISLFGDFGKQLSVSKKRIIRIEAYQIKHPKEYRQNLESFWTSQGMSLSKSYFYGVKNNLYALQAGIGMKKIFAEKAEKSGVEASFVYLGGVTLGLLKPYYLNLE